MKEVGEIVEGWLRKNGYDGLYYDECACKLGDLMPCDEPHTDCAAGYLHRTESDSEYDFVISLDKPKEAKDVI